MIKYPKKRGTLPPKQTNQREPTDRQSDAPTEAAPKHTRTTTDGDSKGNWKFRKKLFLAEKRWQEAYKHYEESIPERHYPLKAQELKELKSAGIINNATFIYFALKLKNPWCDRPIRIKPAEFAVEWDIPESSVYEAIAKLKQSELISIDKAEIIIRWQNDEREVQQRKAEIEAISPEEWKAMKKDYLVGKKDE